MVANEAVEAVPVKLPTKRTVETPGLVEVIIPEEILILPSVLIPVKNTFPSTQSSDVGLVVPIPILVAVNTPTVETPETLS